MSLPKELREHLAKLGRKGGRATTEAKRKAGASNLERARAALAAARAKRKAKGGK